MKKIVKSLLILSLIILCCNNTYAQVPDNTVNKNAIVIGGWLRLRSGPSYSHETIASLPVNTVVQVLSSSNNWSKVRMYDGVEGYMSSQFLNLTNQALTNIQTITDNSNMYVFSYNGKNVRLRSGPSYSYGVIGSYSYGTPLKVLDFGSEWNYVFIGSQYGYMKKEFMTANISGVQNNNPVYLHYVTSNNGLGVRLRQNPSLSANILGVYSVGTEVTVLKKNVSKGWDMVRISGRDGYMMSKYLTKNVPYYQNSYIKDFSISNMNPAVGEVVRVTSVNPSSNGVAYKWVIGNTLISQSNSIVIPSYAAGKTIAVQVYPIGGSANNVITKTFLVKGGNSNQLIDVVLNKTEASVGDVVGVTSLSPSNATANYSWELNGTILGYANSVVVPKEAVGKTINLTVTGTGNTPGVVRKSIKINASAASNLPKPNYTLNFQKDSFTAGDFIIFSVDGNNPQINVNILSSKWYIDGREVSSNPTYIVQPTDQGKTIKLEVQIIDDQMTQSKLEKSIVIN